jgi:hypothetical protein
MAHRNVAPGEEFPSTRIHSAIYDQEDRGLGRPALLEPTTSTDGMATQYVPGDIRDFILKHIASVAQIEALLLIWSNPEKRWSVSHIAARIYAKEPETAKALEGLCAHGLLVREDDAFALNTSEENVEMIGRLKEAYARHLIPVTDVIHGKSRGPRPTAEARSLRRDR